jgi:hypothetical protein
VAFGVSGTDLRAFVVVFVLTAALAAGVAVWSARWVTPKPTAGPTRPVLLIVAGILMACAGVWFAWLATNATLFALTTVATWTVVLLGAMAAGAAVATAVKRPEWMGRRAVAAVVAGGLLLALNAALLASQLPFLVRFHRSLDGVSLQAQQTWEDPPPGLRSDGITARDDPNVIDRLGDFSVGRVGVTDCGPDFPREGLSFWLGDSATTALVWCPLGSPATDATVAVKHLDGAWSLVWAG